MNFFGKRLGRAVGTSLVCAAGAATLALAAGSAGSDGSDGYQPPRFNYGEGQINLVEAVRLTLENDPNLMLDAQDVERQRGILQENTGAFDWNLNIDLSYDYRQQRVRDSTLEREKEKRTDLAAQRDFTCAEEIRQRGELENLQRFAGGDPAATLPNDVQQQVDFLDAIIAAEDNATQRGLLAEARSNLLTRAIDAATEGVTDLANGCVELNEDVANLGPAPEEEEIASGRFDLSLSKYFRSGITLTPYMTAGYDHNQFAGRRNGYFVDRVDENGLPVTTEYGTQLRRFVNFGGKNILDLYRTEIGFDVNLPLLRGRGIESAGAFEKAAQIDLAASELVLRHGSSTSTLSTAFAYWQLYSAQQRVAVLERSLELQTRIGNLTAQLIEGDALPRVESARSAASQANARAQLEGGAAGSRHRPPRAGPRHGARRRRRGQRPARRGPVPDHADAGADPGARSQQLSPPRRSICAPIARRRTSWSPRARSSPKRRGAISRLASIWRCRSRPRRSARRASATPSIAGRAPTAASRSPSTRASATTARRAGTRRTRPWCDSGRSPPSISIGGSASPSSRSSAPSRRPRPASRLRRRPPATSRRRSTPSSRSWGSEPRP